MMKEHVLCACVSKLNASRYKNLIFLEVYRKSQNHSIEQKCNSAFNKLKDINWKDRS